MAIMFTNFGLVTGKNEDVRFVQIHIITLHLEKWWRKNLYISKTFKFKTKSKKAPNVHLLKDDVYENLDISFKIVGRKIWKIKT